MDRRYVEPRKPMWAVAEISWEDPTGKPYHAPATIEDTSVSGACLRVPAPIGIGARLAVKWHREQFHAIARNCRQDGAEFLLGVRRDETGAEARNQTKPQPMPALNGADIATTPDLIAEVQPAPPAQATPVEPARPPEPDRRPPSNIPASHFSSRNEVDCPSSPLPPPPLRSEPQSSRASALDRTSSSPQSSGLPSDRRSHPQSAGASTRQERKVMEPKKLFPNFWRRQQDQNEDTSAKPIHTEAPVNKSNSYTAE